MTTPTVSDGRPTPRTLPAIVETARRASARERRTRLSEGDRAAIASAESGENGDGRGRDTTRDTTLARIRARVTVDANGCWLWQGAKNSRGYGAIALMVEGRRRSLSRSVHRVVAELTFGPLPADAFCCHTCDVKACCNPAHLYIGDRLTNARDAVERGRTNNVLARVNAAKTQCVRGHEFTEDNTYVRPRTGERRCRQCQRDKQANERRRATGRIAA